MRCGRYTVSSWQSSAHGSFDYAGIRPDTNIPKAQSWPHVMHHETLYISGQQAEVSLHDV